MRIISLLKNTVREFKKNGIKGVLKRARYFFVSPRHRLLRNHITEWQRIRKENPKFENMLKDFEPDNHLLSLAIVLNKDFSSELIIQTLERIKRIWKIKNRNIETIITIGKNFPEEKILAVEQWLKKDKKEKFKLFKLGLTDYDYEKLKNKAFKECRGGKIILLKNLEELVKVNFFSRALAKLISGNNWNSNLMEVIENNKELREKLPLKIVYAVPSIGISGGIAVILRHINILQSLGCDVSVLSFNKPPSNNYKWFNNKVPVFQLKEKNSHLLNEIDILVATHWTTAFFMDLAEARRKIYFVQSDERRFDPQDKETIELIQSSYTVKSEYMTEAIWIQRWLKEEFGHDTYYVPNGIDLNIFHKTKPLEPKGNKPRILIEGAIDVWFKGMEDAYRAVKDLDCELWIISCQGKPKKHWKYDKFFEKVDFHKMKKIYSSCDIFLKMSRVEGFFGPPMEAMACECPVVVGKVTGYDEYIKDGDNALVVEQGDFQAAKKAIEKLIADKELRQKLIANGKETVQKWSWEKTGEFLEKAIRKEPVEFFYKEDFPEKYDFTKTLEQIKSINS